MFCEEHISKQLKQFTSKGHFLTEWERVHEGISKFPVGKKIHKWTNSKTLDFMPTGNWKTLWNYPGLSGQNITNCIETNKIEFKKSEMCSNEKIKGKTKVKSSYL